MLRSFLVSLCFGAALVLFTFATLSPEAHAMGCGAEDRCTGSCGRRPEGTKVLCTYTGDTCQGIGDHVCWCQQTAYKCPCNVR